MTSSPDLLDQARHGVSDGEPGDFEALWATLDATTKATLLDPTDNTIPLVVEAMVRDCLAPSGPGRRMAGFLLDKGHGMGGERIAAGFSAIADHLLGDGFGVAADLDRWKDASNRLWGWTDVVALPPNPELGFAMLGAWIHEGFRLLGALGAEEGVLVLDGFSAWLEKGIIHWSGRQNGDLDDALDAVMFYHVRANPEESVSHRQFREDMALFLASEGAQLRPETRAEIESIWPVRLGALSEFLSQLESFIDTHGLQKNVPEAVQDAPPAHRL
jgi:hypothetical protein